MTTTTTVKKCGKYENNAQAWQHPSAQCTPKEKKKIEDKYSAFCGGQWLAEYGLQDELCRLGKVACWHLYRLQWMARENSHNINVVVILLLKLLKSTNFSRISHFPFETYTIEAEHQQFNSSHCYFGVYFIVYPTPFIAYDSAECRYNVLHCLVFVQPLAYQLMQQHQLI